MYNIIQQGLSVSVVCMLALDAGIFTTDDKLELELRDGVFFLFLFSSFFHHPGRGLIVEGREKDVGQKFSSTTKIIVMRIQFVQ